MKAYTDGLRKAIELCANEIDDVGEFPGSTDVKAGMILCMRKVERILRDHEATQDETETEGGE